MHGDALYPGISSSSFTNQFLLTSQGNGENPQKSLTPVVKHRYPDARRGCMGEGAMEVGEDGFIGEGVGFMQGGGTPSFCYGCENWGYSYPVSAF